MHFALQQKMRTGYIALSLSLKKQTNKKKTIDTTSSPQPFLVPGTSFMEDNFSMNWKQGGFRMTQVHYIYCTLYF